jgi:uncharacterized protein (TIGR00266 family)
MKEIVKHAGTSPLLEVALGPGESATAEAGAMVARHPDVRVEIAYASGADRGLWARARGLLVAIVRKLLGGDHFFASRFVAPPSGGWVWLAPAFAGDLHAIDLEGSEARWTLTPGACVVAGHEVRLRPRWAGLGAILDREAAYWLDVEGPGRVWVSGLGPIESLSIDGAVVVDAGHLVGFSRSLSARVRGGRGRPWSTRGEGRAVELTGRGRALVQARSSRALVAHLAPLLPD